MQELRECLQTVALERTTRCVVVRSSVDGVFCAGADLKVWRPTGPKTQPRNLASAWLRPTARILLPHPHLILPPQERAGMSQAEAATFVRELRETFQQLDALPMPTVACVDGWVRDWARGWVTEDWALALTGLRCLAARSAMERTGAAKRPP